MCHFVSDDLAAMRLSRTSKKTEPDPSRIPSRLSWPPLTQSASPYPLVAEPPSPCYPRFIAPFPR